MSCLDVRERLAEHALGVLPEDEAETVTGHLMTCAGCRRELQELQEGAATIGLAMPIQEPVEGLEDVVVERVSLERMVSGGGSDEGAGSGGRSRGRASIPRQVVRVLVSATVAAVIIAVGAVGWAVQERNRAADSKRIAATRLQSVQKVEQLIASFGGKPFHAQLLPSAGNGSAGQAIIVSAPPANSFIFVDVVTAPSPDTGPYTVQLVDRRGKVWTAGQLVRTNNGDLVLYESSSQDLSHIMTVSILDRQSRTVLTGTVGPYDQG